MGEQRDPRTAPNLAAIFAVLARHAVRFVLFGSGGAAAYGANVTPGDLDICPDPAPENLRRLADALVELAARPRVIPGWTTTEERAAWRPIPATLERLDHLYETAFGDFDVVPCPFGPKRAEDRFTYADLVARAVTLDAFGAEITVADVDDLIASKMSRQRVKDVRAYPELARLRAKTSRDR
jgi:hypothetical protein